MKKLMIAIVSAMALGFAANAANTWFNGGIAEGWPNASTLSGGAWSNTNGSSYADSKVKVSADTETPLTFAATDKKNPANATVAVSSSLSFSTAFTKLPSIPSDAKAGVIAFADSDSTNFYVVAKNGDANTWTNTGFTASTDATDITVTFIDATTVVYGFGNSKVTTNTIVEVDSVQNVCMSGDGAISSLSATTEAKGVTFTITEIAGAKPTVTVDGKTVESPYVGTPGATLVVTYKADEGKLFKDGTDTYTFNGTVAAGKIETGVDNQGLTDAKAKIGTTYYLTLQDALNDADDGDTIEMLADVTLDATLTVNKAITLDLGAKTVTLPATGTFGMVIDADATVKNGAIKSSLTANLASSFAFYVNPGKSPTLKNLAIDASYYEYGLACDSDHTGTTLALAYQSAPNSTVTCENVDVTGNGALIYAQWVNLALDANCSAIANDKPLFANASHRTAVYSALNANVTITGGTYTHEKALLSGNLGAKITVNGGTFNGQVYSWMDSTAHNDLEEYDDYVAQFLLNAGTYTGSIAFFKDDDDGASRELDYFKKGTDAIVTALTLPDGYEWDDEGILVKKVEPTTYTITITEPANGTLETSVTNNIAAGTTVTVTATPAEGYELETITTNGTAITGTTFDMPAENVTVAATFKEKASGPTPAAGSDTKVTPVQGEENTYKVEPTGSSTEVAVDNVKSGDTLVVDATVTAIGVQEGEQSGAIIKVRNSGDTAYIPNEAMYGWDGNSFGTALNPDAEVTVGEETIPVTPAVDATAETPVEVTDTQASVAMRTIPGLTYQLIRGTEVGSIETPLTTEGAVKTATGVDTTLVDTAKPADKAFYKIQVTK